MKAHPAHCPEPLRCLPPSGSGATRLRCEILRPRRPVSRHGGTAAEPARPDRRDGGSADRGCRRRLVAALCGGGRAVAGRCRRARCAPAAARRPSAGGAVLSWVEPAPEGGHLLRVARYRERRFEAPVEVARGRDWFVNWGDFPSVVPIAADFWLAHWLVRHPRADSPYHYGIALARSSDDGQHWAPLPAPHADAGPAEHGFAAISPRMTGPLWSGSTAAPTTPAIPSPCAPRISSATAPPPRSASSMPTSAPAAGRPWRGPEAICGWPIVAARRTKSATFSCAAARPQAGRRRSRWPARVGASPVVPPMA